MNPNLVDKNEYIARLQRFHERPHGKAIDDLVVDIISKTRPAPIVERRKPTSNRSGYTDLKTSPQVIIPCLMLEVGCGTGITAKRVADEVQGMRIVATDPNYWQEAEKLNAHSRIMFRALPTVAHRRYDYVVCLNVLGHMPDWEEELFHMVSLMHDEGLLILSVPSRLYEQAMSVKNLFTGYRSDPTLLHRWYDWQLVSYLSDLRLQLIAKHDVAPHGPLCESTVLVFRKKS